MKIETMRWDTLLLDCHLANPAISASGYEIIEDAAIGITGHKITYAGPKARLPSCPPDELATRVIRLEGQLVTPGLIDCHTHLVFSGNRAHEFEMRLNGASYGDISRAGGGIVATVNATRAAPVEELFAASLKRAQMLLREGVTTIEIKSGYGLELNTERRMLEVARRIGEALGITITKTFLGLHTLPIEYRDRRTAYVDQVIGEWLPILHKEELVDAVDAFCERIAFTPAETRRLFQAAQKLGIPVKLHADQLSNCGGAALSAEFAGLSADHIEYSDETAIAAMARAGTVAVLLPGAFYCLRETTLPPIDTLRRHSVPMAIATDLNPGTSPLCSLQLAMNLACTLFRLTPAETFAGVTVNAASAIGMSHRKGRIAMGFDADLAVWEMSSPAELSYWMCGKGPSAIFSMGLEITPLNLD